MVVPSVRLLLNYVKARDEWRQEWQSSFEGKSRVINCVSHVSQNSSFSARELRWCTSSVIFCFDEAFIKFIEKIIAHVGDSLRRTAVYWEVTACGVSDCTASQPTKKRYSAGTRRLALTFEAVKWNEGQQSIQYGETSRRWCCRLW